MKAPIGALAFLSAIALQGRVDSAAADANGARGEWQIDLPSAVSPIMESMRHFNTLLLVIIVSIVALVMGLLLWVMIRYRESANPVPSRVSHNTVIEILWTVLPVLVLVVIAIPSFRLLFRQFDFPKADVVVKATGKQWFWTYSYPDAKFEFDSYPVADADLKAGQLRNLSVDNEMVVPVGKVVRILVTGADVIHQWVVPGFGTRADAIPGRVNEQWFLAKREGIYYGECSALCGQGHPFMPIAVRVVNDGDYQKWVAGKQKTAQAQAGRQFVDRDGEAAIGSQTARN